MSTGRRVDDTTSLDGKWVDLCESRNRPCAPMDDPSPIAGTCPPSFALNLESFLHPKDNAAPRLDEVVFLDVALAWDPSLRCLAHSAHDERSLPKHDCVGVKVLEVRGADQQVHRRDLRHLDLVLEPHEVEAERRVSELPQHR